MMVFREEIAPTKIKSVSGGFNEWSAGKEWGIERQLPGCSVFSVTDDLTFGLRKAGCQQGIPTDQIPTVPTKPF